jgi:hypothetical protein
MGDTGQQPALFESAHRHEHRTFFGRIDRCDIGKAIA